MSMKKLRAEWVKQGLSSHEMEHLSRYYKECEKCKEAYSLVSHVKDCNCNK
ncbi:hypothetical protein [Halalkalibacter oceani]|uniref:hypothetical protein n=1 Tax=Halalkalibacter oceani TaxID=1653776 RepID=UPI003398B1DA